MKSDEGLPKKRRGDTRPLSMLALRARAPALARGADAGAARIGRLSAYGIVARHAAAVSSSSAAIAAAIAVGRHRARKAPASSPGINRRRTHLLHARVMGMVEQESPAPARSEHHGERGEKPIGKYVDKSALWRSADRRIMM